MGQLKLKMLIDLSKTLLLNLSQLEQTEKLWDIKIVTGTDKTVFRLHRLVLALRSKYFMAYL